MSKFCPECGKEISDRVKFCPECGINIRSQNPVPDSSPKDDNTTKSIQTDNLVNEPTNDTGRTGAGSDKAPPQIILSLNNITIISICIFLLITCLVVIPTKTITHDVEVAYTDTETFFEKEPYSAQQLYQEQEPYQTTETYTDSVPVPVSVPYQDYDYSYQTSDAGTGMYYGSIPSGCVCSSTRNMYDKDGVYGALCVQLTCQISTPVTKYRTEMQQQSIQKERPVTKYQTVTKTRNVTEYRDVAKTRDVMKTRIEQQPLEVNWLLGFKVPYSLHLPVISGN